MRIRSACKKDIPIIQEMFNKSDFKIDPTHLERLIVSETEEGQVIGILMLNTVLECTFVTSDNLSRKSRIQSLRALYEIGKREVKAIGYDLVHGFSNDKISPILLKHFNFQEGKGRNLVLFVE